MAATSTSSRDLMQSSLSKRILFNVKGSARWLRRRACDVRPALTQFSFLGQFLPTSNHVLFQGEPDYAHVL